MCKEEWVVFVYDVNVGMRPKTDDVCVMLHNAVKCVRITRGMVKCVRITRGIVKCVRIT